MPKQIFYLDQDLDFALDKEALFFSHEEKMAALHRAQIELFCHYYGNVIEYQPGRPIPRVAYQMTQAVSSALKPFLVEANPEISDQLGLAPEDMVHPTAIRTAFNGAKVVIVDDDKLADRLTSLIVPPTEDNPVCEILSNGWRFYPDTLETFYLKYLALPTLPVYATTDEEGELVYDDAASVDVLWEPIHHNELLNRALVILGVNVRDSTVINVSDREVIQGQ